MAIRKRRKQILSDVLDELNGEESKRPKGVGVTSHDYVMGQLELLWDLI